MANDMYSSMAQLAALDLRLFPVHGTITTHNGVGCTCGNRDCQDIAKHPVAYHGGLPAAAPNPGWWLDHPHHGAAVATGPGSGVWVIDVDGDVGKAQLKR